MRNCLAEERARDRTAHAGDLGARTTCRLLVPEGWTFNAGKGQALCHSPDGDIGYIYAIVGFVANRDSAL